MKFEEFMGIIREYNEEEKNKKSRATILRRKIMKENHSNEEWLKLQDELRSFIASNPSQEELNELQGCGECLEMICSAIGKEGAEWMQ